MRLEILDPRPTRTASTSTDEVVVDSLAGLPIAIIDNSKPRFDVFVETLAAEIREHHGALEGLRFRKPDAAHVAPEGWLDQIAAKRGVAIVGWGDCGSCSTCTFLDAAHLISRGVPAVAVISEAFRELTSTLARSRGLDQVPRLVLPHPPSMLSDEELAALARDRVAEAVALLSSDVAGGVLPASAEEVTR
jgi:hypothetical protein